MMSKKEALYIVWMTTLCGLLTEKLSSLIPDDEYFALYLLADEACRKHDFNSLRKIAQEHLESCPLYSRFENHTN